MNVVEQAGYAAEIPSLILVNRAPVPSSSTRTDDITVMIESRQGQKCVHANAREARLGPEAASHLSAVPKARLSNGQRGSPQHIACSPDGNSLDVP